MRICRICGREIPPQSHQRLYCKECAAATAEERKHGHYRKYNAKRKLIQKYVEPEPKEGETPTEPERKKPSVSIAEISRLAAQSHMTYGKYVEMLEKGAIPKGDRENGGN